MPVSQDFTARHRSLQVSAQAKDIIFDNESRQRMQAGINKLADAVGVTLGPRGEDSNLWSPEPHKPFLHTVTCQPSLAGVTRMID